MKILVTGIGITGKSTFRRNLVNHFRERGSKVKHFDADCFKEIRHPLDESCLKKLPKIFDSEAIYVIEDVHATENSAVLPLKDYDLIYYVKSDFFSHILFWLSRMKIWFKTGKFSWEPKKGWKGTGKARDLRNVPFILKDFFHDLKNRKKWVGEDMELLIPLNRQIVNSKWTKKGAKLTIAV